MMQPTDTSTPTGPGRLLRHPGELPQTDLATLRGYGGLHGGLLLSLLTSELAGRGVDRQLRYVTAQFHRPAMGAIELIAEAPEAGRSVTRVHGRATGEGKTLMTATAVFSDVSTGPEMSAEHAASTTRGIPAVGQPEDHERVMLSAELVPFLRHIEIRPTDENLPFSGGTRPTLSAWIRLVEDDEAPDVSRLIMMMDAMAPSYAGLVSGPVIMPTLELGVRLFSIPPIESSPWILLRATTHHFEDGWLDERIDAWTPAGTLAATATQVRLLR